jgi:hypothetical protein
MNDEDTMTLPKSHDRCATSRPKTTMITRRDEGPNMVVIGNDALPDRQRELDHRVGDDHGRWPFRVSQIEIRRQFQEAFKQSLAEKAQRPATTATQFPHLLEASVAARGHKTETPEI